MRNRKKWIWTPILFIAIGFLWSNLKTNFPEQTTKLTELVVTSVENTSIDDYKQIFDSNIQEYDNGTTTDIFSEVKLEQNTPEESQVISFEQNQALAGFTQSEIELGRTSFESYSELDELGRCGVAFASIGQDIMPTEERGEIGHIKPSGWPKHNEKYPELIEGLYLFNRCHLIAFCLAGENDNEKNLITGTRYLNVEEMLPIETKVLDYVKSTGNHVLYRVTPIYQGTDLIASGVLMEGYSVEDNGSGINYSVYLENKQPGIQFDYTNGESWRISQ